jgi:hypothetical protein
MFPLAVDKLCSSGLTRRRRRRSTIKLPFSSHASVRMKRFSLKMTIEQTAFEAHCFGAINTVYERYVFYQRRQENGETFEAFLSDIRRLVKTCDFGTVEDSAIRDRIVMGIRDDATRKRLLQTRNIDLKGAIDSCRASSGEDKQFWRCCSPSPPQCCSGKILFGGC